METIWFGLKLGVGFTLGLLLMILLWRGTRAVRGFLLDRKFVKAGFTWEPGLQGWLSRDPSNDDWILWDAQDKRVMRRKDPENPFLAAECTWEPSGESVGDCLSVGVAYLKRMGLD